MSLILWLNTAFVALVFGIAVWFLVWRIRTKLAEVEGRQTGSRDRFFTALRAEDEAQ